ncbi:hypothetical protein Goklo_018915 [Gossypium klotzschianum]|uniref:DNA-directed RNA polymerase n=1 Tax=Gossypium klotzschianum TaxID=34286 RepID=A0A7J8UMY6_9ROSI|nr:hypothetical protein [Gossypium klotzschianum]
MSREDALCLANKMKKITVADTLENMEVFISPFSVHNGDICSIYKLKIRLVKPGRYFKKSDISVEDCRTCETEHDGGDDTDDEGRGEDLGLDVQKQKQQTTYEMDYENESGGEQLERRKTPDNDMVNEPHVLLAQFPAFYYTLFSEKYVLLINATFGLCCHNIVQIAENTAKKVYVQSFGKIDRCRVTDYSENQVFYYGEDPKKRKTQSDKEKIPALHTDGVDLGAFREMEDQLDVRYLYSNGIHAMLNRYGVEAARETIIREISHVFTSYGIAVDIRHLTLL